MNWNSNILQKKGLYLNNYICNQKCSFEICKVQSLNWEIWIIIHPQEHANLAALFQTFKVGILKFCLY